MLAEPNAGPAADDANQRACGQTPSLGPRVVSAAINCCHHGIDRPDRKCLRGYGPLVAAAHDGRSTAGQE